MNCLCIRSSSLIALSFSIFIGAISPAYTFDDVDLSSIGFSTIENTEIMIPSESGWRFFGVVGQKVTNLLEFRQAETRIDNGEPPDKVYLGLGASLATQKVTSKISSDLLGIAKRRCLSPNKSVVLVCLGGGLALAAGGYLIEEAARKRVEAADEALNAAAVKSVGKTMGSEIEQGSKSGQGLRVIGTYNNQNNQMVYEELPDSECNEFEGSLMDYAKAEQPTMGDNCATLSIQEDEKHFSVLGQCKSSRADGAEGTWSKWLYEASINSENNLETSWAVQNSAGEALEIAGRSVFGLCEIEPQ